MKILRPKVVINKSLTGIFAQLVDVDGKTLCGAKYTYKKGQKPVEQAGKFGEDFAKKAAGQKATKIVFERNGHLYHGQVKSFADGLRKGGLQF